MITLEQAKQTGCCRICGGVICEPGDKPFGYPAGWKDIFRVMLYPLNVTLNYGEEFAHTTCLNASKCDAETEPSA